LEFANQGGCTKLWVSASFQVFKGMRPPPEKPFHDVFFMTRLLGERAKHRAERATFQNTWLVRERGCAAAFAAAAAAVPTTSQWRDTYLLYGREIPLCHCSPQLHNGATPICFMAGRPHSAIAAHNFTMARHLSAFLPVSLPLITPFDDARFFGSSKRSNNGPTPVFVVYPSSCVVLQMAKSRINSTQFSFVTASGLFEIFANMALYFTRSEAQSSEQAWRGVVSYGPTHAARQPGGIFIGKCACTTRPFGTHAAGYRTISAAIENLAVVLCSAFFRGSKTVETNLEFSDNSEVWR
jgi:hypothetical protein